MSGDGNAAALAAILDALTLVQGQLDTVTRSNARIEATQSDMMARLDTIDAGQAAVTDLVPVLETILARSIEDRGLVRRQFETVATIAGFAHAAAAGSAAPLPVAVADDPLLEAFAFVQPADRAGTERALVAWHDAVATVDVDQLSAMLVHQYEPSPTDSAESRVLRYRMAAITRAEIESRGGSVPQAPASTIASDRSAAARAKRSAALARLWRAGEGAALFAEPELAGALDLFARAEQIGAGRSEDELSADLAALHRELGDRIEAGDRPSRSCLPADEHAGGRQDRLPIDRTER